MNSLEEPDPNIYTFIRQNSGQSDLFFPKHYLLLEVERLKVSIKHFYEAGILSKEDYEYIGITLKMIKRFLTIHLQCPRESKPEIQQKHTVSKQPSLFDSPKPLPITGEVIVSGLNESLKALRPKSPDNTGPKFPYKIPAGTHWSNVIIKFLDNEQVEIWVKKLQHVTDYKEMGMVGKGNTPKPCEQWHFLKVLAQYNGELTIKDPEAKDKYKKQKQGLSETLRNYFSIDYDPFYPYQSCLEKCGNSYKIKLMLIPPPVKNHSEENLINEEVDELGINEFLNETAPQVVDS
jgi:hypothetical protein